MATNDEIAEAAWELANLDQYLWFDVGPSLTCIEANVIADILRLTGGEEMADQMLRNHAAGDDGGDLHFHLREEVT